MVFTMVFTADLSGSAATRGHQFQRQMSTANGYNGSTYEICPPQRLPQRSRIASLFIYSNWETQQEVIYDMGLSENGSTPKSYSQYYCLFFAQKKTNQTTPICRFPKMGHLPPNHPVMSRFRSETYVSLGIPHDLRSSQAVPSAGQVTASLSLVLPARHTCAGRYWNSGAGNFSLFFTGTNQNISKPVFSSFRSSLQKTAWSCRK